MSLTEQFCVVCDDFLGLVSDNLRDTPKTCEGCESIERYGEAFEEAREVVIERDNHECQKCGKHENDVSYLDCHHINGDRPTPDNLVMLCRPCHGAVESGEVSINR